MLVEKVGWPSGGVRGGRSGFLTSIALVAFVSGYRLFVLEINSGGVELAKSWRVTNGCMGAAKPRSLSVWKGL